MNKKKMILGATTIVIAIFIVGCSNGSNPVNSSNTSTVNTKQEEIKVDTSRQTVDGLALSANAKIGVVKGDRTKDNVADDNGEYMADGSDIVKAADYKSIIVDIDIKNDSDRVADLSQLHWSGVLQDGYQLNSKITGDEKDSQIQAKSSGKYEFKFLVKKDIEAEKLHLYYLWIKNKDEYQKLMQKASVMDPTVHYPAPNNKDELDNIMTGIRLLCDINN